MNFAQFLKLMQSVLTYAPNVLPLLLTAVNAAAFKDKLAAIGEIIDTILANKAEAKAVLEANAVMALDAEQEESLVFETCGLFRNRHPDVSAEAFDGSKLKALFTLIQPFLPLILKLIGLPVA